MDDREALRRYILLEWTGHGSWVPLPVLGKG